MNIGDSDDCIVHGFVVLETHVKVVKVLAQ